MSFIPGADGDKSVFKDGIQVDHLSENTVGHGVRVRGISNGDTPAAGDVGESGRIAMSASPVSSGSAYVDSPATFTLQPGVYAIYSNVACQVVTSGTNVTPYIAVALRTSGNTVVEQVFKSMSTVVASRPDLMDVYSISTIVKPTSATTYKMSAQSNGATPTVQILADGVTPGGIAGGCASFVSWVRIA
jgi:hypothetical protein